MEKLGRRFGRGRAVAIGRRRGRLRGDALASSSRPKARCADGHRASPSWATSTATWPRSTPPWPTSKRHDPDRIAVTGDLVLNGPRPAEAGRRVRGARRGRRARHPGQHRHRRRRRRLRGRLPVARRGARSAHRAAAEWAHDQLSDDELDYLRRLPVRAPPLGRRRCSCWSATPRRAARPSGLPADLDPSVTVERVTRTDARVIGCGHTHVADVRELGRKLIVNPGSCGYAFDGDAGRRLGAADRSTTTSRRGASCIPRRPTTPRPAADEVSARGLPGDVYRAATIRTGRLVR